ncbi:MAG: hypothetical protein HPM95_06385 [Alphaproteobacteria bacterium]|nr:hypothetical protein [Alphaproteobacteria bacterium]
MRFPALLPGSPFWARRWGFSMLEGRGDAGAAGWPCCRRVSSRPSSAMFRILSAGEGVPAIVQTVSWVPSLGIDLVLRLDGFSLLFVPMITGIGTLVALYAGSYYADKPASGSGPVPVVSCFSSGDAGPLRSPTI